MIEGNFATIDERRIYVRIDTYNTHNPLPTINIDNSNNIRFADDPVQISESQDSLDNPLYLSQATVSFLCKDNTIIDHIMELSQYDKVGISIDDMTSHTIIFNGIVEIKTFNQDYAESWTQIDINAYDYMTTLENYKYKDWINWNDASKTATNKTIRDILISLFNNVGYNYHQTFHIYYDNSISVDGQTSILDCIFNEHIFYGEEVDDAMNRQEILVEILKYFNLTARQLDNRIYIYSAPVQGTVQFTRIDDATLHASINFSNVNVQADTYHDTDTQISYDEPKKSYSLSVDLEMIEKLFENVASDDLLTSPYTYYTNLYKDINSEGSGDKQELSYHHILGKVEFPTNMTLQFYDVNTQSIRQVSDLIYYDTDPNIRLTEPISRQWWAFYRAKWQSYFIPFFCSFGSTELYPDIDGYCYKTRDIDASHKFIINFNTSAFDINNPINKDNIINAINNITSVGMVKFNNLNLTSLNPDSNDITNYLVFNGTVKYSPEQYSMLSWTSNEFPLFKHYGATLINNQNQILHPGGMQTGETLNQWHYAGSDRPETGRPDADQYEKKYYNGSIPNQDSWKDIETDPTPLQIVMNGNTYYTNQGITTSDNRNIENMNKLLRYTTGSTVVQDYTPYYNLRDNGVAYVRNWTGFNIVKVPVLICECNIGDKWCVEVSDPDNVGHTKFIWMTQSEAVAANITNLTFTLGIWPMKDGKSIFEPNSFINNKIHSNITIDGEAIPIRKSDNLSGNISFKIIAPYIPMTPKYVNGVWEDAMELNPKAPDCYKYGCWYRNDVMSKYMGFGINQLEIDDFECSIVSDNLNVDEDAAGTSITYTNERPETPEEYEFMIASGLTNQEYVDNNIISGPAWNYIYNGNNPIMAISNPTYSNIKPEKLYIQRMYDLMNIAPKYVSTTLGYENTMNNIYKFTWDPTHTYYPVGCDYDVKLGHKTFNLVAYNPWTNTNI